MLVFDYCRVTACKNVVIKFVDGGVDMVVYISVARM